VGNIGTKKQLQARLDNTARYLHPHAKDEKEKRLRNKGLCHLRATFRMAQEVGKGLGRGPLLLGPVP